MNFSRFLALLLVVVCAAFVYAQDDSYEKRALEGRILARLLARYPAAHRMLRRFDYSPQEPELAMSKRNNAEVVNHILKNFGTLDRLGDVGRR